MSIKYNGKTVAGNYKIKLSNEASTTEEGLIRIATDEEAKAGELTNVAVTPEQLSKYGGGGSSGGGTNTLVDDVTIVKDEDTDIITTIGMRTKNDKYLYDWIGTKAEYNKAVANGEISLDEDCICWITDDSGSGGGGTVSVDIATTETAGIVKPDGTTITVTEDGTISAIGGGSSTTVVETDNKTITLNDEDKIQVVGSYTVNSQFKNEFVGTREEYEQALAEGIITEDTVCTIIDDTQDVIVPIATSENLGVIKPDGETITVNENGIISAIVPDIDTSNLANIDLSNITDAGLQSIISNLSTVATSGSYNDLTDKPTIPNEYILPTASTDVLGGVKVDGTTISIVDGIISSLVKGGDEWEYSKSSNGYLKHKPSGLVIASGTTSFNIASSTATGNYTKSITYTKPFGSSVLYNNFMSSTSATGATISCSGSKTGITVSYSYVKGNAITVTVRWLAFGY